MAKEGTYGGKSSTQATHKRHTSNVQVTKMGGQKEQQWRETIEARQGICYDEIMGSQGAKAVYPPSSEGFYPPDERREGCQCMLHTLI